MSTIKTIELILENCETIDVTNAVGDFQLNDIHVSVHRIASNCIAKVLLAKNVFIQLYKDGEFNPHLFDDKLTPIERLKTYRDITSVVVTYVDGTEETYAVDYDEGEEEGLLGAENINQQCRETETSLFILISASQKLEDMEIEEIDSEWYLDENVKARIDLKARGWQELFNNEIIYQSYLPTKKIGVSLSHSIVRLSHVDEILQSVEFNPNVFKELLSYLFYVCEIRNNVSQSDFKYLTLTNIKKVIDDTIQTHTLTLNKHVVVIQFDSSNAELNGTVSFDDGQIIFDMSDMLAFMWILLAICEDN